ncbi:MAG TPA: hypothetical protein VMK12_24625 [Anaeromyxobacteraceae bacterium]|nr:hypothetical protein [Anaeromyxobacteraceae bacterium]
MARSWRLGRQGSGTAGGSSRVDPEVGALMRDMTLMTRRNPHMPDRIVSLLIVDWAADQGEVRAETGFIDLTRR